MPSEETVETEQLEDSPQPERKTRRRKPVRRQPKTQPIPQNEVRLKAEFNLPVDQFSRLTADDDERDYEETLEDDDEADSRFNRNLLFGDGLASVPFRTPVADEDRSEHVRNHLRQVSEANAFKARIWQVPESFAQRNPLIQRKPASTPGWAMRGEIQYDPETLETDLLALFADGYYFVEIRESGQFRSGQVVTVGDPSSLKTTIQPTAQPTIVHEPAPQTDPVKEATAQAKVLDTVLTATTRLLEAQTAQQPAQVKQPSLKDRLEELKMMQQMFAPPVPQQVQRDPLEKLAEALESETLKKVLSSIKSENPVQTAPEQSGFWDFAMSAVEMLSPGLNPLLAGLGRMLMTSGANSPSPDSNSAPKPVQKPTALSVAPSPVSEPEVIEEDGVDIRFLIVDLADNVPPEQTAQKINALMASKPFIRPFLKKYLAADNQTIWNDLIGLADNEVEAADMRQALESCDWRDTWLNSLKQLLQG